LRDNLTNFIVRATCNHVPSDLILPDSWDDRPLPLCPAIG
jgi:hypothetical protein